MFSHSVMSSSLEPCGLQHARPPCPSSSPGVCSISCPLNQWCHPTISSSVIPFSCLQSFSASETFPVSWLFASSDQNIGASVSASVLPMNIHSWFLLGLTAWSPCCPMNSQESSPTPQFKSFNSLALNLLYGLTLTSVHDYWKNHSFDYMDVCQQIISLLFNRPSRFVIAFVPRSKHLLISRLLLPCAMILESKKIKSVTVSIVSPPIWHEIMVKIDPRSLLPDKLKTKQK